jgi:DNA polymerase IIIc chi subunit
VGDREREEESLLNQNLKRKKTVFSNNKILIVCLVREREREKERAREEWRECRVKRNEEERGIYGIRAHSR